MNTTDCEKIECKLGKELKSCKVNDANIYQNSCQEKINEKILSIPRKINKATSDSVVILESIQPTKCTSYMFTPSEEHKDSTKIGTLSCMYCDDVTANFDGLQQLSERWSPLGANYDDDVIPSSELLNQVSEIERFNSDNVSFNQRGDPTEIRLLQVEQEILASSLMALTSHFAHVQLRVRQIVEAPSIERDKLLKDLEQFAFQGIPDTYSNNSNAASSMASNDNTKNLSESNEHQFEFINQLKNHLSHLETLAYESSAALLPQHILLDKQKVIIDELKHKLNFEVNEEKLYKLSKDEIKSQVDNAIGEFIAPIKMKEQLVAQLKTQITDLERFIAFLQSDSVESKMKSINSSEKSWGAYNSYAAKKKNESSKSKENNAKLTDYPREELTNCIADIESAKVPESIKTKNLHCRATGLLDKASLIMQMLASTYLGPKREQFQKNTLKKTNNGNHWGDLRAQLEVAIQEVASIAATLSCSREKFSKLSKTIKTSNTNDVVAERAKIHLLCSKNNSKASDLKQGKLLKSFSIISGSSEDVLNVSNLFDMQKENNRRMTRCSNVCDDTINTLSKELITAVRKNFAVTLMKLIEHGVKGVPISPVPSSLMVPFTRCLNRSSVFIAEHSYRVREFTTSSFMSSTVAGDRADTKTPNCSNYERGGLFTTSSSRPMHAWELILEYYHLTNGKEFNNTPARKLSQSFNLDIGNVEVVTIKQNLLSVVGNIIAMHRPYKRSYSAQFKAFVSAGLNSHQLAEWLNLIFGSADITQNYYTNFSYVACTGFQDAIRSIEGLSKYNFDLPVDLAIRHFHNL